MERLKAFWELRREKSVFVLLLSLWLTDTCILTAERSECDPERALGNLQSPHLANANASIIELEPTLIHAVLFCFCSVLSFLMFC